MPVIVAIIGILTAGLLSATGPLYTAGGIVNAASGQPGPLAPGMLVSIYGQGLSYVTHAVSPEDLHDNTLPTLFSGAGIHVSVGGLSAFLYYVSPTQVNVLIPGLLYPGPADVVVTLNGLYGPTARINLLPAAPAVFQMDGQYAVATRLDGSVLTKDNPGHGGDIIVVYATGLGLAVTTNPDGRLPDRAAALQRTDSFRVRVNGALLDPANVYYVGLTPGFAGLYQVNLKLPSTLEDTPEVRIGFDDAMSPEHVLLHVVASPQEP